MKKIKLTEAQYKVLSEKIQDEKNGKKLLQEQFSKLTKNDGKK